MKSWDAVAEKVYGDVDKAAFAKSEFEEYLKRFSNTEEQNETAETDGEEASGYLAEVAKMMDELEELLHERDALMIRYSQELGVDLVNRANYLFTKNLKELSGAVLHKLVFVYRLAAVLSIEKYLGYKLPLLIDSPSGKEVDRENVNAMMKILARDFSKNQIIVASIYEYDFDDVNKVIINGKLIDQEVKTYK